MSHIVHFPQEAPVNYRNIETKVIHMDISWELFIKVTFNLWIIISLITVCWWLTKVTSSVTYKMPTLENLRFLIYLGFLIGIMQIFYYGSERFFPRTTGTIIEAERGGYFGILLCAAALYMITDYCKLKTKIYYVELMNRWYFEEKERDDANIVLLTDSRANMIPFLFNLGDKVQLKSGYYMGTVVSGKHTDNEDSYSTIYYIQTEEGRIIRKPEEELEKV